MEKFRNVFRITLIFLFLIFSFFQYGEQLFAQQNFSLQSSMNRDNVTKPAEGLVIDVSGSTETYDNRTETLHLKIANLTGSTIDSLKIHMLAPNVLKKGVGHNLYCWFQSVTGDDSVYFRQRTEVFENPQYKNKMDSLIIYLKELIPTNNVDESPYELNITFKIDSVQFSTNLIFYFELYTWNNEYFPRSEEIWTMQIAKSPNFSVSKYVNKADRVYYPGEQGVFIIRYKCQVVTAHNVQVIDNFPDNLNFISSIPDVDSLIQSNKYIWHDDTLKQDSLRQILINFDNNYLRKECLNGNGDDPSFMRQEQNSGELRWGDFTKGFGRIIYIMAEPDLTVNISSLNENVIYSPGTTVMPLVSLKNIGGKAVSDSFKVTAKIAKLTNNVAQEKVVLNTFSYNPAILQEFNPSRVDSFVKFLQLNLPKEAGEYRLFIEVDADSAIRELDDVWAAGEMSPADSTFLP
ncbi:hypothetical protein B6D60_10195, partial [candidate division KSB1 bacterium 4484_87]